MSDRYSIRQEVLRTLAVVKIATCRQIEMLNRPHMSFRRKESGSRIPNSSYSRHLGQLEEEGISVRYGIDKRRGNIWGLTERGFFEAHRLNPRLLERPTAPFSVRPGSLEKGLLVTDAIAGLLRPRLDLRRLAGQPSAVIAEAVASVQAESGGVGVMRSYASTVTLGEPTRLDAPSGASLTVDATLHAPLSGIPLLFVYVVGKGNSAKVLGAKMSAHVRFFGAPGEGRDRSSRILGSRMRLAGIPAVSYSPPVLVVASDRFYYGSSKVIREIPEAKFGSPESGIHWARVPFVVTDIESLVNHGPEGKVFTRLGRRSFQSLRGALSPIS